MRLLAFITRKVILLDRIKDLERTIESLQGANSILERELSRANGEKDKLLNKLFEVTGINKREREPAPQQPVVNFSRMARTGKNWAEVRATLENNALEKYWEQKKQVQEEKDKKAGLTLDPKIENFEKELEEGELKENVNQIS